jgi:hypothetical protein
LREILSPVFGDMFVCSRSAEEVNGQVFVKSFIIFRIIFLKIESTDFEYHLGIKNVFMFAK